MPDRLNPKALGVSHLRRELLRASYRLATATTPAQRYWLAEERAALVRKIARAKGRGEG